MNRFRSLCCALPLLLLSITVPAKKSSGGAPARPNIFAVAHRGCHLKGYINENCPAGIRMARRYGYPAIECDVKYTKDSVMVVMHDKTINRTMRRASDYGTIEEKVYVAQTTYEDLCKNYVLASTDPALRTPIPTLEEMLQTCKEEGIIAMLHSRLPASYRRAQEVLGDDGWIAFCRDGKDIRAVRSFSNCLILIDFRDKPVEEALKVLRKVGGRVGQSSMRHQMMDAAYIGQLRSEGFEVQASIWRAPYEERAMQDGVTMELSDFWWYQTDGRKPCRRETMADRTLKRGEVIDLDLGKKTFSAVTADLWFKGAVKVTLCGRNYELTQSRFKRRTVCTRLYKKAAKLRIEALKDTRIKNLDAALYEL